MNLFLCSKISLLVILFSQFCLAAKIQSKPTSISVSNSVSGSLTFQERCSQPGIVRCFGFDVDADFNKGIGGTNGAEGQNYGVRPAAGTSDYTRAALDTTIKSSGAGSLKFTIPSNTSDDTSGTWFTNFSPDLSVQFGENEEFYVQWRQRFSTEFITTKYQGAGGFKHVIIGTGDTAGKTAGSCTDLEFVLHNYNQSQYPNMYNSCTGSASHAAYQDLYEAFGGDFKMQNKMPSPFCLYSQQNTSSFLPTGNCFGYAANEWMTFQIHIKLGPRVGDEWKNGLAELWMAREGQPSVLVHSQSWNFSAGSVAANQKFGKIWLTPYNTGKSAAQSHPTTYTWFDELVISRTKIADPK